VDPHDKEAVKREYLRPVPGHRGVETSDPYGTPLDTISGCEGDSCKLTILTEDSEEDDSTLLGLIKSMAWDARRSQGPPHTRNMKNRKLGGPSDPEPTPSPYVDDPRPGHWLTTESPFMALFTFACECGPIARLLWYKQDSTGAFKPDSQGLTDAATVSSAAFYNLLKIGGACWIAAIDSPGRSRPANVSPPAPPTGSWRIVGVVRWLDDSICVDEATVTITDGRVSTSRSPRDGGVVLK
jgi:hypothetical protein